eukprot:Em0769g3a
MDDATVRISMGLRLDYLYVKVIPANTVGQRVGQVSGEANSFAYLTQRLSVAVQRGNAASVLGTNEAASLSEGAAVEEAEVRKHRANDPKCSELGWVCIPLAVETYGNWGREAQSTFSRLASHLAIITSSHKSYWLYLSIITTLSGAIPLASAIHASTSNSFKELCLD